MPSSGVTITASASANGTLGGTTTANTDASGLAGFSNLTVSGVQGDAFTITFSATGLTSATTGSLSFAFFDIQTEQDDVDTSIPIDVTKHAVAGTKPVAVDTFGLRTFDRGSVRFDDPVRAPLADPARYNHPR